MKKLVFTVLFLFALSSVGLAAPLMDYSKGSVSFDYTYRPNLDMGGSLQLVGSINCPELNKDARTMSTSGFDFDKSWSYNFDGSANLDAGVTIGLGNKWAVQYRQYNPEGTIWTLPSKVIHFSIDGKIKSEEVNVLYKIAPKASAFVGVVKASTALKANLGISGDFGSIGTNIPEFRSDDKNIVQVGLLGTANIAKNLDAYGIVSFGSEYRNWEAGISYNFDKNWALNVNYRDTRFDNFDFAGASYTPPAGAGFPGSYANVNFNDITVKGWGFGLTYKF